MTGLQYDKEYNFLFKTPTSRYKKELPWPRRTVNRKEQGKKKGMTAQCGPWSRQALPLQHSRGNEDDRNTGCAPQGKRRDGANPNTEENGVYCQGKPRKQQDTEKFLLLLIAAQKQQLVRNSLMEFLKAIPGHIKGGSCRRFTRSNRIRWTIQSAK